MPYRFKCTIQKLDESTPYIWPYITDFHPVGPGGYEDQQKDGGDPVETYSWRVMNNWTDLWFLFGLNVEIIPEGSSWWYSFITNIGGTKTTILLWYTFEDAPLITWKIEFIHTRYAFTEVLSSDNESSAVAYDTVDIDETAPFLDSFAKVEEGDDRVYWYLHFTGNYGLPQFPYPVPFLPALNIPLNGINQPFPP